MFRELERRADNKKPLWLFRTKGATKMVYYFLILKENFEPKSLPFCDGKLEVNVVNYQKWLFQGIYGVRKA